MFKRILKWLGGIILIAIVLIAVFLINLIWFRPWSLNLFYEKVFAETIFSEPELLSSLGLVEQEARIPDKVVSGLKEMGALERRRQRRTCPSCGRQIRARVLRPRAREFLVIERCPA